MEMIQSFRKRSRVNTDLGKFFSTTEDLRKHIQQIRKLVEELKWKQAEILAIPISNDTRNQQLGEINTKFKSLSQIIRARLKVLEKGCQQGQRDSVNVGGRSGSFGIGTPELESPTTPMSPGPFANTFQTATTSSTAIDATTIGYIPVALRIRRTQHSILAKEFSDILNEYQQVQVKFRDHLKARLIRQLEITNTSGTEEYVDAMIETGNVAIFTKSVIFETDAKFRTIRTLEDLQTRHTDLKRVEKAIKELSELFSEMSHLVESQGCIADNIEQNLAKTMEYVASANKSVKQATRYNDKIKKKKVCLLTTGGVVCSLTLLIIIILLAYYL